MTKEEALQALERGEKVRHYYFSDYEWMKKEGNHTYLFENGVRVQDYEFWKYREAEGWDRDWEVVQENSPE